MNDPEIKRMIERLRERFGDWLEEMEFRGVVYHEAGHAVAAMVRRVDFDTVTIVPTADYVGCLFWGPGPQPIERVIREWAPQELRAFDESDVRAIDDRIVVALAGPIAEARLVGRRNDASAETDDRIVRHLAWAIDWEYLGAEVADGTSGPVNEGYLRQQRVNGLREEARTLVLDQWPVVDRVVAELVAHRTLSQDKIRELVG